MAKLSELKLQQVSILYACPSNRCDIIHLIDDRVKENVFSFVPLLSFESKKMYFSITLYQSHSSYFLN